MGRWGFAFGPLCRVLRVHFWVMLGMNTGQWGMDLSGRALLHSATTSSSLWKHRWTKSGDRAPICLPIMAHMQQVTATFSKPDSPPPPLPFPAPEKKHFKVSKYSLLQHPKHFFRKKSLTMPKKTERGPFGLVRYCMLRGKLFWFSSLGKQVKFEIL